MLNAALMQMIDQPLSGMTADSREVKAGSLFVAYPGVVGDGRDYIASAIANGAAAVLWEDDATSGKRFTWSSDWQVSNLGVHHLKQQIGEIAARFFKQPSTQLKMIGVTGTNGKTTVSQWLAQCLTILGEKAAVIGTIGNGFVDAITPAINTTPDAIVLQAMLQSFVKQAAKAVAMEVSSHGLAQGRVNGVVFDVAVLTNLSRDHLDYHNTMEAYAAAKRQLFEQEGLQIAIVNADDAFGNTIAADFKRDNKILYSYGMAADVWAQHVQGHDLVLGEETLTMRVTTPKGEGVLKANVLGEFNAYNLLAVLATLMSLDVDLAQALAAMNHIKPVAGRMQQLGGAPLPLVVIDYAHTPDALEKVLLTLNNQLQGQGALTCVFGCGGDRDVGKRALMGQVVSQYADVIMVTSDNPRSEDPLTITTAITAAIDAHYSVEVDRAQAIQQAVGNAKSGDVVLIAGKGHENYQEIAGVRYPFNDALIAEQALAQYTAPTGVSL